MTKIADFLKARLQEELAYHGAVSLTYYVEPRVFSEIQFKLKVIEWHENWPMLVQGPEKTEFVGPGSEQLTANYRVDGMLEPAVGAIHLRMTQRVQWMTQQEYIKRFGENPPTAPILRMMAELYSDHPDYQEAIS